MQESDHFRRLCGLVLALLLGCGGQESAMLSAVIEAGSSSLNARNCEAGPLSGATVATTHGRGTTLFLESKPEARALLQKMGEAGMVGPPENVRIGGGILSRKITAHPIAEEWRELFEFRTFLQADQGQLQGICFARRIPTEIVEFTEPASEGGQIVSNVLFRYREEPIEPGPPVEVIGLLTGVSAPSEEMAGQGRAALVKTNKGWKAQLVVFE